MRQEIETIVVGGGLVGSSMALGLASRGRRVLVLDGNDQDFRASRGNFGLTWIQGKGADNQAYAKLNSIAARLWQPFADELLENTGVDIGFHQPGGLDFCLNQDEWDARSEEMHRVSEHTNGEFIYEMLEHVELKKLVPQISDKVLGASYSPHDGHLNPLYLLKALHKQMTSLGCIYQPNQTVMSIKIESGIFVLETNNHQFRSEKIVLCAGLNNQRLAQDLGMLVPLHPIRGQLLITERLKHFLQYPSVQIRQTEEGSLQIGDSHDDVGHNDGVTLGVIKRMSKRAVTIFPHLHDVQLTRAWGALRIMTPDGLPIYQRSAQHPGAYAISCHSGVTLAVIHSDIIADWICGDSSHTLIPEFSTDRLNV